MKILKQRKVKDAKIVRNVTKLISKNNNRCTVNDFISACSLFVYFYFFFFYKIHLLVTFDVIT